MAEGNAVRVALAYFHAWTRRDVDRAMTYVADDVVCDAPAGRITGIDAFRDFMGPFARLVLAADVLAVAGDDETALLMYDTRTVPVESAPAAEHVTVRDGRITRTRIIFDRAPFDAARAAADRVDG